MMGRKSLPHKGVNTNFVPLNGYEGTSTGSRSFASTAARAMVLVCTVLGLGLVLVRYGTVAGLWAL